MMQAYNISRAYLENVILTTYLPTRPEYNYIEIRADELSNFFEEIDQKSKSVIKSWDVKYFLMSEILNSKIKSS